MWVRPPHSPPEFMKKLIIGIAILLVFFLSQAVTGQTGAPTAVEKRQLEFLKVIEQQIEVVKQQEKESAILQKMIYERKEKLQLMRARILKLNEEIENQDELIKLLVKLVGK